MGFTDLPAKYYKEEGFLSLMGIGYTAALAVTGLGILNLVSDIIRNDRPAPIAVGAIVGGGALATWGYLKSSGVLY